MTATNAYNDIRRAQETLSDAASARARDVGALFSMVPSLGNGMLNPTDAITQYGRVAKRLVEVNLEYVTDLAGAVRKHIKGLAGVLKDEVVTTAKVANDQAEKLEVAAIEQADEIQRAERAAARRAKKVAHDAAAERYANMTKVELSNELGNRHLPKAGTVDGLRERLIDSDIQAAG
jgi:hypothetical protein